MSAAIFGASQLKPARQTLFTQGRNSKLVLKAARQMAKIAATMGTEGIKKTVPRVLVAKSDLECRQILRNSVFDICCPRQPLLQLLGIKVHDDSALVAKQRNLAILTRRNFDLIKMIGNRIPIDRLLGVSHRHVHVVGRHDGRSTPLTEPIAYLLRVLHRTRQVMLKSASDPSSR